MANPSLFLLLIYLFVTIFLSFRKYPGVLPAAVNLICSTELQLQNPAA